MDLLNRLSESECLKLCHRVVDGLCGRPCPQRRDYESTWTLDEWRQLMDSLMDTFCLSVGRNRSDQEVQWGLSALSGGRADVVLDVLKARRDDVHQALLQKTDAISSSTLHDFDWQLKLGLSSDKIWSLQTPLLSVSLDVMEQRSLRSVTLEMDRDELNSLVTSLEAANKVVLQLK